MSTRDSHPRDDRSIEERALSRLYEESARETPPAALDAKILAVSRDALNVSRPRGAFVRRWAGPISAAAVVVLVVGIVLRLSQEPTLVSKESPSAIVQTQRAPAASADDSPLRARVDSEPHAETKPPSAPPTIETKSPERRLQDRTDSFAGTTAKVESPAKPSAAPSVGTMNATSDRVQAAKESSPRTQTSERPEAREFLRTMTGANTTSDRANIVSVSVSGNSGSYQFTVGIRSPDRGCSEYADWWEVLSVDGALLYRRVLDHSHVDEQPFERTGGPVRISPTTIVWVRAHMNRLGYGGAAFKGSVETGFAPAALANNFAPNLAHQPPLPEACAF
jgi:hypothetical protein